MSGCQVFFRASILRVGAAESWVSQSPIQEREEARTIHNRRPNFSFETLERKLAVSRNSFGIDQALKYLVTAILCSLDGFTKARERLNLAMGYQLETRALKLTTSKMPEWGKLKVTC